MHPSSATVVALILVVAAASLVALAAITVRPAPRGPTVTTHAAPGAQPRVHGRDPSSARRTPRRGAGRRTARPAARPTPVPTALPEILVTEAPHQETADTPPAQRPEAVVEAYYRALDARRFKEAWTVLSPAVHAAFGGFERWRDGFATTLSSSPRDIELAREGAAVSLAHELVTEDRSSCGPVRRTFRVRWRLEPDGDAWRAASLTGVKTAGPEPAGACAGRHDPARAAGGR